jgi:aminocarboxymuconate-semialdehyde decarboxylase
VRIDVHAHLIPQAFWSATEGGGEWYRASQRERDGVHYIVTRDRLAGPQEPLWRASLEERLAVMDRQGVDMQLLATPPYFFNYHLPAEEAAAAARELNDEIAQAMRDAPTRIGGLATVPLQDPALAIAELERTMALGFHGATLGTHVDGRDFDDPAVFPFFEAAERLGALIFFHPHAPATQASGRTSSYYLENFIGFPLDSTIAIASLIFGGVLDRLPALKLVFAHAGGYACYAIGRWDHGFGVRREPHAHVERPPRDYLRLLYVDTITHDYPALRYVIETMGADHVVLGSDFPFDMGYESPVGWLEGAPGLSAAEREQILGGTLQRLLGLD